ncbi:DUF6221 family protein [Streptomyces sp. NPDC046215]|uniref:DUF6221 family protein n=1 Tax=Streptomyces sp. NPDC046215 TaxID=3155774 RepID=UPI00340873E7
MTFLHARLDEDEQVARAAQPAPWVRRDHVAGVHADNATEARPYGSAVADCRRVPDGYGVPNALHIVRHAPARVLAEVDAKRAIVEEIEDAEVRWYGDKLIPVLKRLALPYADHPDYREEWRP